MIAAFLAGTLAGAIHVLSGPDHLAAIAPLAARTGRRAWVTGVRWGMGHSVGVAGVALLAFLLRGLLPLESISGWSERFVGVVLIGIGIWALRSAVTKRLHTHEHEHDGHRHTHIHAHGANRAELRTRHAHSHAAFTVGVLHGLAGSSHFLGVLPALALPSPGAAAAYLSGYAIASIGAMGAFSLVIGRLSGLLGEAGGERAYRGMLTACGSAAIVVGIFWIAG